jgi:hypothetical protein
MRCTSFWRIPSLNSHSGYEAQAGLLVVMCHDGKELSLKLRKIYFGRRIQVVFGLNGPNDE